MDSSSAQESVFYEDGSSLVTQTRAIIAGTLYPIASISSVRVGNIPPSPLGWLLLILGAFFVIAKAEQLGVFLIAIGALIAISKRRQYVLMITTAGGEKTALKSLSQQPIVAIVNALNEAIVARG